MARTIAAGARISGRESIEMYEDEGPNWLEQSEARGEARGRRLMLVDMARDRFDDMSARALDAFLSTAASDDVLKKASGWLLSSDSGAALVHEIEAA